MLRQAVVPQSTASVGTVLSMPIVSARQSEALPATSTTRLRACARPRSVIDTAGVVTVAPPSSLYSTRPTPDPGLASVPVTVRRVVRSCATAAVGSGVVLTGAVWSTLMVSVRHGETLPALSTTRVSSVCVPSVVDDRGASPTWIVPPSTRHSPWSTPDAASVPVSGERERGVCQAVGAAALVLTGSTVSTL